MSETAQILTSCDVPDCLTLSTRLIDRHGVMPRGLPDGWHEYAGKTYCPRHIVAILVCVDGRPVDV
jgi:hypothetical protein